MGQKKEIEEHRKLKKQNVITGDVPAILVDVLDELSQLRADYDGLEARVKTLEKK